MKTGDLYQIMMSTVCRGWRIGTDRQQKRRMRRRALSFGVLPIAVFNGRGNIPSNKDTPPVGKQDTESF